MNFHACAVTLNGRGVLIAGASASGKTRLALTLLREARRDGLPAALVSDDQVLLAAGADGRLVATAPPAIAGLVEVRGFGVLSVPFEPACALDLLVRLVPATGAPRMGENSREEISGVLLPRLDVAERDADGAALAVRAFLFASLW